MIVGTLQYMAPEQLEGKPADARTDLWAFGAILYEMITGKRAFEGASQASVISAIMSAEPAPLSNPHQVAGDRGQKLIDVAMWRERGKTIKIVREAQFRRLVRASP